MFRRRNHQQQRGKTKQRTGTGQCGKGLADTHRLVQQVKQQDNKSSQQDQLQKRHAHTVS